MIEITPMAHADVDLFDAHFARHRAESGRGDIHFMPFAPDDEEGPRGLNAEALDFSLSTPGWHRWWLAWHDGQVVGHVDLKGGGIKSVMHRCELGIGIERAFRAQGLGRRLMQAAIEFVAESDELDWIDLRVFAHNKNARALYRSLGFVEQATYADWIRINDESIDDVTMVLDLR